ESCNEGSNNCTANDPNGCACNDGNQCTSNDQCSNGTCTGTPQCSSPSDCNDGNPCTTDACNNGCCENNPSPPGTSCTDDGNECTVNRCLTGQCAVLFLDPGLSCGDPFDSDCNPADTCDGAGNCLDNIRDDGTPCFHDGLFCTGADLCQGGVCESAGDPCTADGRICDENAELRNECSCDQELEGVCDDGLFCSGVEVCNDGLCLSSGDPCDGTGLLCDEATDRCACGGLSNCDDGVFCNGAETCVGDVCVSAGDPCHLPTPFCDEVTDTCTCTSDADCEDGDACTGVESCDAEGTCRHSLVFDCNVNGLEDTCDLDSEDGESLDCNHNGVPDECDLDVLHNCCEGAHGAGCNSPQIAACVCAVDAYCCDVDWDRICAEQVETLECGLCAFHNDCNGNGVPDACDIDAPFTSGSESLSPIDDASTQSHTFVSPPPAAGDVTLIFTASADLQASSEFIDIDINGTPVGAVFQTGANDCPITPDAATLIVLAPVFNSVVEGGDAVVTMTPSSNVDVFVCTSPYIIVSIEYETGGSDCNSNGIPDECDLADGTSDDCTENGRPDECEADCNENHIADICEVNDGTAIDCNRNGVPDDCDVLDATSLDCQPNGIPDECDVPSIQLLTNGTFETGDLTGWVQIHTGPGEFGIDDGTLDPPGPGGQVPPCHGIFSFVISQNGPGRHSLYQQVTIPDDATAASLSWTDRIRNHAVEFSDPNQEFTVEIWDTDDVILSEVFSTDPGDPLISDCTERTFDVSTFIGQTIRVAFTEEDDLNYFNVNIDNVRLTIPTDGASQDCNQNLIPDECDISSGAGGDCNLNTTLDECEAIGGGDFNNDSSVHLDDYAFFAECLGGPGVSPTPTDPICTNLCLAAFDLDADGDTDLKDAGAFQTVFGAVVP
ncbi:MAG: hypothetical protein IH987_12600, partial [Planctomycetes bacterium]|nr:hypothetical protein [Planctomycetota bacterium]